ncbi:MAG TPA: DUF72 domain-containing protein [Chryseosolibacter sp.]
MTTKNPFANYYAGLSGIVLPIPKYKFPPEFENSSRLTYYGSHFNSIEINRSFYGLPNSKTVSKWTAQVPDNFTFTFKVWKQITHAKDLQFEEQDVKQFMDAIATVGSKKGCLLVQFPASAKIQCMPGLERLLASIQFSNPDNAWKVAIEFRDRTWYCDEMFDLIQTHEATVVRHDKSRASTPHISYDSDTVYLRFHGPEGDYRGSYTDEFLQEYSTYIIEWLSSGKFVFVYFNNTMGQAFDNLTTLNRYVYRR